MNVVIVLLNSILCGVFKHYMCGVRCSVFFFSFFLHFFFVFSLTELNEIWSREYNAMECDSIKLMGQYIKGADKLHIDWLQFSVNYFGWFWMISASFFFLSFFFFLVGSRAIELVVELNQMVVSVICLLISKVVIRVENNQIHLLVLYG